MTSEERPDPEQQAVLDDQSLRLLVEAPPGSGKTRTAVLLARRDIDSGRVGPTQRVLVLTFSRNARAQLQGYADGLMNADQRRRCLITNFHAFFADKVLQHRTSLGLPAGAELCTNAQRERDLDSILETVGVALPRKRRAAVRADYARALEYSLPEGRPARLSDSEPPRITDVGAALSELHRRTGRIHFDDLAYYAWCLVDGSRAIRELWRHKYPVAVLDEYQDTSPLQSAIVERVAGPASRVYAFADPLQQIYTWRDASPERLSEFRGTGCSEHRLRTLHRYRARPAMQRWMEQARDVLLDQGALIDADRPPEVIVQHYDHALPQRRVRGTETRELGAINRYVSRGFKSDEISSIAVLTRRRDQLAVIEKHLAKNFRCSRLGSYDARLDEIAEWVESYPAAISPEHHARRLLYLGNLVAPRHSHLADLDARIGPSGISASRLREPRRSLAIAINDLLGQCDSVTGALRAAESMITISSAEQDPNALDHEAIRAFRRALMSPPGDDTSTVERVRARIQQARHRPANAETLRGLYLLTCHEGKGKEFDLVILPWVHTDNFEDDDESRQLLYVSLTRARRAVVVRVDPKSAPPVCRRLGLA